MLKKAVQIATIDVDLVTVVTDEATPQEYALTTSSEIAVSPEIETTDAVKLIIKGTLLAQKRKLETLTGHTITLTDNVLTPELVKILQGGTITYGTTAVGTGNAGLLLAPKTSSCTIALVSPNAANAVLGVVVVGSDITVNLATDAGKVATSTATAVKAAIEASVPANALLTVTLAGTGASAMLAKVKTVISTVITGYTPPVAGSAAVVPAFTLCAYTAQYDAAGTIVRYEKIEYPNCIGNPVAFGAKDGEFRVNTYTIFSAPDTGQAPYDITYVDTLPAVA